MDLMEACATLSLFQLELPDTNCELSTQIFEPPLKEFTFFPILPRELRDRVWSLSLPGARVINLNPSPLGHNNSFKAPPLPQALHICQESRSIALKHYHLIFFGPETRRVKSKNKEGVLVKTEKTSKMVMAVDTGVDNIYLRYSDAAEHLYTRQSGWLWAWYILTGQHKDFLGSIKSLEIRDVRWNMDSIYIGNLSFLARYWVEDKNSPLYHLTGLKEMHMISHKYKNDGPDDGVDEYGASHMEYCVGAFRVLFMRYTKLDPSRVVPQIFLHDWRRSQARTEEKNSQDGTIDCRLTNEMLEELLR